MSRRSSSCDYGVSFWLSLPLAGLFCAAASVADRPADPAPARRLFRHGDAGADRGRAPARARPADHQRREGHHQHPAAGADLRCSASLSCRDFETLRRTATRPSISSPSSLMVLCFAGALSAGPFAHRAALSVAAAERGARLVDGVNVAGAARARLCDLVLLRRGRRRDLRRHRAIDLSVELHGHR